MSECSNVQNLAHMLRLSIVADPLGCSGLDLLPEVLLRKKIGSLTAKCIYCWPASEPYEIEENIPR